MICNKNIRGFSVVRLARMYQKGEIPGNIVYGYDVVLDVIYRYRILAGMDDPCFLCLINESVGRKVKVVDDCDAWFYLSKDDCIRDIIDNHQMTMHYLQIELDRWKKKL